MIQQRERTKIERATAVAGAALDDINEIRHPCHKNKKEKMIIEKAATKIAGTLRRDERKLVIDMGEHEIEIREEGRIKSLGLAMPLDSKEELEAATRLLRIGLVTLEETPGISVNGISMEATFTNLGRTVASSL